jgi:16S rRNA C1402 (ribose-2'-O) methylase RsmI
MTQHDIAKTLGRIAELLVVGADAATAQDYTERMKEFSDAEFSQVVKWVKQEILKGLDATPAPISSADMTMQILKTKYGKE